MKYLTGFATEADAMARSAALYEPYRPPGSVTACLVGWRPHPDGLTWVLCVDPDSEPLLPPEGRAALVELTWPPDE